MGLICSCSLLSGTGLEEIRDAPLPLETLDSFAVWREAANQLPLQTTGVKAGLRAGGRGPLRRRRSSDCVVVVFCSSSALRAFSSGILFKSEVKTNLHLCRPIVVVLEMFEVR